MPRFVNFNFPSKKVAYIENEESKYEDCIFGRGHTFIPTRHSHVFENCRFKTGSILRFEKGSNFVHFYNCVFTHDVVIDLRRGCGFLSLTDRDNYAEEVFVFQGSVRTLFFNRYNPSKLLPTFVRFQKLYIHDQVYWEIDEPFVIPPRMDVHYSSGEKFKTRHTLDILIFMMWRHPCFTMDDIEWDGNPDDLIEFQKTQKHPYRCQAAIVFALLKVLPKDLIRGVLIGFLV